MQPSVLEPSDFGVLFASMGRTEESENTTRGPQGLWPVRSAEGSRTQVQKLEMNSITRFPHL